MTHYHDEIKKIKELEEAYSLRINIDEKFVVLCPVDESSETIRLLTEWRNKHWDAFPEKFNATEERTRIWLKNQVIHNPDRLLFLILLDGQKIGHIGTYRYDINDNSAEIDNVVRAVRNGHPGLMQKVTVFLIKWMFEDLKLSKIKLKVFSDNYKAINLYERCKMMTVGSIPLKRIITPEGWKWQPMEVNDTTVYGERYFSMMEISKINYFEEKHS